MISHQVDISLLFKLQEYDHMYYNELGYGKNAACS